MNKQGRRTVGLLARLQDARELVRRKEEQGSEVLLRGALEMGELDPDTTDAAEVRRAMDAVLGKLIDVGHDHERFWATVVHEDYSELPPPHIAREIKSDWEHWGRIGMAICREVGVPISRLGALTGRV